jgi:hypothetical protein
MEVSPLFGKNPSRAPPVSPGSNPYTNWALAEAAPKDIAASMAAPKIDFRILWPPEK